jgi:hypothetical protein
VRRILPLLVIAGLGAAGATAIAQGGNTTDPYAAPEPNVTSTQVLRLPDATSGCDATRSATVRVTPPTGAILGYVRVVVDGRQAARLTGIPRAASATVRVPISGARLTASALTLGGQKLAVSRIYADCTRPPEPKSPGVGEG